MSSENLGIWFSFVKNITIFQQPLLSTITLKNKKFQFSTAQTMTFSKNFFSKAQFSADLVTFTEEILNEKLHFLCSVWESLPLPLCHMIEIDLHRLYFLSARQLLALIVLTKNMQEGIRVRFYFFGSYMGAFNKRKKINSVDMNNLKKIGD